MAKILVVDDDTEFAESVTTILECEGHKVICASNGADGYERAVKDHPDLLLLDVMMKADNEGFEIARKLSASSETKHLPIILVTGIRMARGLPFSFEPDEDWLPVKAVLDKPVKPEVLLRSVTEALRR
jgi:two-component system, OmpR family, alkaline phosphatase synthesis response regulator PhoP